MSSLLDTPAMKKIKNAGGMIGDREVLAVLLRQLLKPEYRDGVILDGFPRTTVQVECLKMLYEKMTQLWRELKLINQLGVTRGQMEAPPRVLPRKGA